MPASFFADHAPFACLNASDPAALSDAYGAPMWPSSSRVEAVALPAYRVSWTLQVALTLRGTLSAICPAA